MTSETTAPAPVGPQPLLRSIDQVIDRPVLVIGAPSERQPVRLLAREREFRAIQSHLAAGGLTRWRTTWASFGAEGPLAVELVPADDALFDPGDDDELFQGCTPVPESEHLARPAPHVVLLLEAWASMGRRGRLSSAGRQRALAAAAGNEQVWSAARALAPAPQLRRELRALERAITRGSGAGAIRARELGRGGVRRRPILVSLSGPDGSGKSTQIEELRRSLEAAGQQVGVAWAPTVPRPPRRGGGGRGTRPAGAGERAPVDRVRAAALRMAEHGWVGVVAVRNAAEMWRHVWRERQQELVLFDRFSLDAEVKLEYWYAHRRGMNLAVEQRLFRLIAPRADVAVLLVVPPGINRSRRPEDWTPEELQVFWSIYRRVARSVGASTVEASRGVREVAADVANIVWQRLP